MPKTVLSGVTPWCTRACTARYVVVGIATTRPSSMVIRVSDPCLVTDTGRCSVMAVRVTATRRGPVPALGPAAALAPTAGDTAAASDPLHQLRARLDLQPREVMADRWLRVVQLFRGLGDRSVTGHRVDDDTEPGDMIPNLIAVHDASAVPDHRDRAHVGQGARRAHAARDSLTCHARKLG